ncbi:MAG: elongation factor G [bacterium]|nr:elongation factor G [bacterium]
MADILPQNIRNIAVIGNNGAGKTSLSDAILFDSKTAKRLGKVDEKTSAFDFLEEEIKRKMTITISLAQFPYKEKKINLIDTPGYMDFIGEAISALYAVETAVAVVAAGDAAQFNTIKLLSDAQKRGMARIIFINKIDKENINYEEALEKLKENIPSGTMPVTIPAKEGNQVTGVINLLDNKLYAVNNENTEIRDIPEALKGTADVFRIKMLEAVAETKEDLMEKYLEKGSLTEEELTKGLKEGLLSGSIIPVFCGIAVRNIGTAPLLHFLETSAPSPLDKGKIKVKKIETGSEIESSVDEKAPAKAFVFKTQTEPHIGELNFVRVFSGTINYGDEIYNSSKSFSEKVGTLDNLIGKERKEVKTVAAGDIAVLLKLKKTAINDTLCSPSEKMEFPRIDFPRPLLDLAIKAKSKADEDKLSVNLHKLLEEDPTLKIRVDSELKQTIISGMGETQINIFVANLKNKYNVEVEFEKTKVPYRETIKKKAQAQGRYKRQTGGHGQYGDCWLEIEPLPMNHKEDFEFVDKIVGGSIPGKYVPAVEKGVREKLTKGLLAGYPVIKVRASVYDGTYHSVDSSDLAFQIAGSLALQNAAPSANPVLLEPVMKVKVYTPDKYMGDIISDLNSRRAKISGMDDESGLKVVNAFVPQAEMFKYINDLKSITQGSGIFESAFDHYEEVPFELSKKIVEQAKLEKGTEEEK